MVWVLEFGRLTGTVTGVQPCGVLIFVPSGWATSLMESAGWVSSFWMVPVPTALAIRSEERRVGKEGRASSWSNEVKTNTSTVTGLLVSTGAKVSVVLL